MNKFKKIFNGKRVLITGHTGFKGSWLTLWMVVLGAKVIGISKNIPTKPSLFNELKLKKKIKHIKADITNIRILKKIFKQNKPDFVFHLAAQSLVKKSYEEPYLTFMTNSIGTLNILESLKEIKKKCISIIITSDKSYRNLELQRGYKENDILGGSDPYSASKASAENVLNCYVKSYFNKKNNNILIGIARAGNVIGGGDWSSDRLVPDCIKALSKNKKVLIRNPNSTRPWQHVLEALSGYITFSIKLKKNTKLHGEVFNFGPKKIQNKSVINLILEIKKNWNRVFWKIDRKKNILFESNLLKLNSTKAKQILHWESRLSFKKTIKLVVDWYKNFYEKKQNVYEFTKKQIINYSKI